MKIRWIPKHKATFQRILEDILKPPILLKLIDGEVLLLYLALSEMMVSAALAREEERIQRPMYFVRKRFTGTEMRCPKLEKLTCALLVVSKKLRSYFQAHPIKILTDHPF